MRKYITLILAVIAFSISGTATATQPLTYGNVISFFKKLSAAHGSAKALMSSLKASGPIPTITIIASSSWKIPMRTSRSHFT